MRFHSSYLLPVAALIVACGGGGDSTNGGITPTTPTTPTTPVTPTLTNQVTVSDNVFTPSSIQVSPGTTVTWTWASDASTHNVTISGGNSGDKVAGATFTKNFATAGTFNYQCTIHPGMNGSVLVQ